MSGIHLMVLGTFSTGDSKNWDIAYLDYDPPSAYRYQLGTSGWEYQQGNINGTVTGLTNVETSSTSLNGIYLGGTASSPKVFTVGTTGDKIYGYTSVGYGVTAVSATANLQSASISGHNTAPGGLFFKPDGTKCWTVRGYSSSTAAVYSYTLATPWDLSTLTYDNVSVNINALGSGTTSGLWFSSDGAFFFVGDNTNDLVRKFSMSTNWDIGSTVALAQTFSVSSYEGTIKGVAFSSNGLHMYITGTVNDNLDHFTLGTPYDLSTASFTDSEFTGDATSPYGLYVDPDGRYIAFNKGPGSTSCFVVGALGSYDLNAIISGGLSGLFIDANGTKAYTLTYSGTTGQGKIHQLSFSSAYDLTTVSLVRTQSVDSTDVNMRNVFFKPDGTKLFYVANPSSSSRVVSYDLGTAWDVSTISGRSTFSVNNVFVDAKGIYFNSDGTKMYVCGYQITTSTIYIMYEYNLATAWDITTASISTNLNLGNGTGYNLSPYGIWFNDDGTKMYLSGTGLSTGEYGEITLQADLDTAWSISSISSYKRNGFASILTQQPVEGVSWSYDGSKFFVLSQERLAKFSINANLT